MEEFVALADYNTIFATDALLLPFGMPFPHLNNPPISQAILEILTESSDASYEKISLFGEVIKDEFPHQTIIRSLQGKVSLDTDAKDELTKEKSGIVAYDNTNNNSLQIRRDGYAFINLNKTYAGFEVFKNQAKGYFEQYIEFFEIIRIKRVSLRFINTLAIPDDVEDIGTILSTYPTIGEGIPNSLNGFFLQIRVAKAEYGATAVITQAYDASDSANQNVILDIDVIKDVDFPSDDNSIWDEAFESLRAFKNEIFFYSLTPSMIDRYQ